MYSLSEEELERTMVEAQRQTRKFCADSYLDYDTMLSEAYEGIVKAQNEFRMDRGSSWWSYVRIRISWALNNGAHSNKLIKTRVPGAVKLEPVEEDVATVYQDECVQDDLEQVVKAVLDYVSESEEFTRTDRRVIKNLVDNPDISKTEIGQRLSVSRQTVCNRLESIRKKLKESKHYNMYKEVFDGNS
jgi:DNA-directed RNA polymerase specialized sigma subunit